MRRSKTSTSDRRAGDGRAARIDHGRLRREVARVEPPSARRGARRASAAGHSGDASRHGLRLAVRDRGTRARPAAPAARPRRGSSRDGGARRAGGVERQLLARCTALRRAPARAPRPSSSSSSRRRRSARTMPSRTRAVGEGEVVEAVGRRERARRAAARAARRAARRAAAGEVLRRRGRAGTSVHGDERLGGQAAASPCMSGTRNSSTRNAARTSSSRCCRAPAAGRRAPAASHDLVACRAWRPRDRPTCSRRCRVASHASGSSYCSSLPRWRIESVAGRSAAGTDGEAAQRLAAEHVLHVHRLAGAEERAVEDRVRDGRLRATLVDGRWKRHGSMPWSQVECTKAEVVAALRHDEEAAVELRASALRSRSRRRVLGARWRAVASRAGSAAMRRDALRRRSCRCQSTLPAQSWTETRAPRDRLRRVERRHPDERRCLAPLEVHGQVRHERRRGHVQRLRLAEERGAEPRARQLDHVEAGPGERDADHLQRLGAVRLGQAEGDGRPRRDRRRRTPTRRAWPSPRGAATAGSRRRGSAGRGRSGPAPARPSPSASPTRSASSPDRARGCAP